MLIAEYFSLQLDAYLASVRKASKLDALQKQARLGCCLVADNGPANVFKQTCDWRAPGSR